MRVFVAGGTGAIGTHAVPALTDAGHTVRALARDPAKAGWLRSVGARPVAASLFDRARLERAFRGCDAVVNLASAMPKGMLGFAFNRTWRATERLRTEGSAAVADAAAAAGVPRLVQESVAMVYPDGGARWISEDTPADPYPHAVANLAAERSARRFGEAGGTATVLRFGLFYGPGAVHTERMLLSAGRHLGLQLGPAAHYTSSIHLADAAAAVLAALGAPAGTFNVVDDEPLTKRAYANALCAAAGARPWLRLPGPSALLLGERLTSLTRSLRVDNARFRAATGWAPRYPSAREGLLAMTAA